MKIIKDNIEGIFKSDKIRKTKFKGEIYYVVLDTVTHFIRSVQFLLNKNSVIEFIIKSKNPKEYLHKLKLRNSNFDDWGVQSKIAYALFLVTSWLKQTDKFVHPLIFETSKGKREINCINLDGILKLIEFIPSKKIEEFKNHLYEIGLLKIKGIGEN